MFHSNDVVSLVLEDTVQRNSHGCDQEGYQQRYIYIKDQIVNIRERG